MNRGIRVIDSLRQSHQGTLHRGQGWLALLAGLVIAAGVIAVWSVIDSRAHEHVHVSTHHKADITQLLISQDVDNRFTALDRLAQRWIVTGGKTREIWEADAKRYLADMPGFEAIERMDAMMQQRWTVWSTESATQQSLDITQFEQVRTAIEAARDSGKMTVSDPFGLDSGGSCLTVILPVSKDKQYDGVIVGALQLESWVRSVIGNVQTSDHQVRVLLQGTEVYRNDIGDGSINSTDTENVSFLTHGIEWTIQITPASSFLSAGHADSSMLVLIAGLLLSALVSTVVYLALVARARSRQFHDAAMRFEGLIQNLPGMAYRRANVPSRTLGSVSEGCHALTGYSRHELNEGQVSWDELIHPNDRDSVAKEMGRAVDAAEAFELEYRIVDRNGGERWVWERGRLVDSEFDDVPHVEGIISDVTDRKHAEISLSEARAFSDAVVDTAADAVITIDSSGAIDKFNRAAQEMFGYSFAEAHDADVGILMPESYQSEHQRFLSRYLETDQARVIGTGREIIAKRKDGSVFPIYLSISEVHTGPNRRFVGLIRDISEQRAAENEARQHREHLAHVDRLNMLGEMATGIAHEINQPLTAISLFAQAGTRMMESDNKERLPEIFDKLIQHAHRASAVIERMQTMTRRHESQREIIDCDALIEEVAKLAEAEARIRDMTIEVETEQGLPDVEVDAVQIQQVALNLLRNGMESMQSIDCLHGNSIGLQTKLGNDGNIKVAVIDKGSGVSDEVSKVLFAPFSTTKKSGMGMGLSISRAIVLAHGGRLDFYNNEYGGATFFFTLPPADQGDRYEQ